MREFFRFSEPLWLLALLVLPLAGWLAWKRRAEPGASLLHSRASAMRGMPRGWKARLAPVLEALPWLALAFWAVALARPQFGTVFEQMSEQGIDIMLAMDISGSMLAEDFRPDNRLGVAKDVAKKFVEGRPHDRMGLVVFAGQSVPRCPPTLDHGLLVQTIDRTEVGQLDDGTAVGMGMAVALERLKRSDAKSRILILLTDGKNNRGHIDPLTAADLARVLGVKIYTIGIGSHGRVPMPVESPLGVRQYRYVYMEFDEESLKEIAERTGGRYFPAQSAEALREVFGVIDQLEKTDIQATSYTRFRETFPRYVRMGLLVWGSYLLLGALAWRRLP